MHEEGLWIPRAKLYEAGKPNEVLFDIIRHNVRTKDEVMGDIAAQVSSGKVGAERLQLLCDRHNLDDIDDLSAEIIKRSDTAKGFELLPRRWVVERTFAWLGRCRRLAKAGRLPSKAPPAWPYLASIRLMTRRLARYCFCN